MTLPAAGTAMNGDILTMFGLLYKHVSRQKAWVKTVQACGVYPKVKVVFMMKEKLHQNHPDTPGGLYPSPHVV